MSFLGSIFRRSFLSLNKTRGLQIDNLSSKNKYKKWKRKEIILFLERLEMYLSSGLEINKALEVSEQGLKNKQKLSIRSLRKTVESGAPLYSALTRFVGTGKTTSGLVEYGELSGTLARSLLTAKTLLEKEDELLKRCTGAMIYPLVIGVFALLLTIGLIRGVMTQIIPMLKSLNVDLPFITKLTITLSEVVTGYGFYILVGIVSGAIAGRFIIKKYENPRFVLQSAIIRAPIGGKLFYNFYLAIFLHSCGALVDSGLSVKDSYDKTTRTISLLPLNRFLYVQSTKVAIGLPLGEVINHKRLPSYVTPLLNAGELSGTLGQSIMRAGNIVDKEIEHSLKKLTSLIEPVMMVGMGCVVGTIALSIMLPIYNISGALQK
jgi:type IV pilus assembly protein PilC